MESLRTDATIKRVMINDDPEKVLSFDPTDTLFVDRFYALLGDFEGKQAEYEKRAEKIDKVQDVDSHGLPVNIPERLQFMKDMCEDMCAGIDRVFGDRTSQMLFDGRLSLEAIGQFFESVTPFVTSVRSQKVAQYVPTPPGTTKRKAKPKVMR